MKTNKKICKNCYYSTRCNRVTTGLVCGVETTPNMQIFIPVDKNYSCYKYNKPTDTK